MTQITLTPFHNNDLFSNYFLTNQLLRLPEWSSSDHIGAFEKIKEIYIREKNLIQSYNEKQLEDHFFKPIFQILSHNFEVTEVTQSQEFPDFAFFPTEQARVDAHQNRNTHSFYANTLAIGEVKQLSVDLDRFGRDEYNRNRNPSLQLWMYLVDTEPRWGILSNGRLWRLYCKDKRRNNYFEINLITLIESGDVDNFRYFYYFFRKDAFLPINSLDPFIDRVLHDSAEYAKEIGEDLKDNVYKAMKKIAEGFIQWEENQLEIQNPLVLELVQKNTMLLLYRILFILYAEGRGLLSLRELQYRDNYSLFKIKYEIKQKFEGSSHQRYLPIGTSLFSRLRDLFRLIDKGSVSLGISQDDFFVPAYNGGLFDPAKNQDLERWKIGDSYIAEAIDLLSRGKVFGSSTDFIDYSTLHIRHLGSIYEGLLEYRLKIAHHDLVVKDDNWVTLNEFNANRRQPCQFDDFNEYDRVKAGQIYLVTDKGERKLTGSYYTPDFIVDYIVNHTINPIIESKILAVKGTDTSAVESVLSINVLDPAMGSGHFLVGAIDILAQGLLKAVQHDIENGKISDATNFTSEWAFREVVSHCIYGVDINDLAVELAKVSLWLSTISKDKPLSFLDHRLKQGNSLVGAKLSDLRYYPGTAPEGSHAQTELPTSISPRFIGHILNKITELENLTEYSLEDVKTKERIFEEFKQLPEYQRAKGIGNVYVGIYFGNNIPSSDRRSSATYYQDLVWALAGDETEWKRKSNNSWYKQANIKGSDLSFFHWELEFPDIFFEGGKIQSNPGWDAVIGNPPYIRQELLSNDFKEYSKEFYKSAFGTADIYVYFLEQGHKLLKKSGYFGVICSNKYMKVNYGRNIRNYIKNSSKIVTIIDFGELPVFRDAATFPSVIITQKEKTENQNFIFAAIKNLTFNSLDDEVSQIGIIQKNQSLQGENWNFSTDIEHDLIEKIKSKSITLNEYVDGNFYWGVKTGCNTAFIIDKRKSEQLISLDPKNSEIIKPLIVGDDIRKYQYHFQDSYIIFTRRGIDITKYPSMLDYLEQFREILEPKPSGWDNSTPWPGRKAGNYQWYEIQDTIEFYEELSKNKIIYPEMAMTPRFAYDSHGFFINNKGFFIPTNDLYLLALLNSNLIWFVLKKMCSALGDQDAGGRLELRSTYLVNLPIMKIHDVASPIIRKNIIEEGQLLYSAFSSSLNDAPILDFIFERLTINPAQLDIVRDFLDFLAKEMIDLNEKKNIEIKTFLHFIEQETGGLIEDMSNKTKIKVYHDLDFTSFINILNKNKRVMKEGYNPKSPQAYRLLNEWFDDSLSRLKPLILQIDITDQLINKIIYQLFDLTSDEIKLIENQENET